MTGAVGGPPMVATTSLVNPDDRRRHRRQLKALSRLSGDRTSCYQQEMLLLTCLCCQVRIQAKQKPDFINECNCTLCSKAGARWGYFHPSEVSVEGTGTGYCRSDKDDPAAQVHFCPTCGATTHWRLTPSAVLKFGDTLMGVNMRLADEQD